jgi:hypothetical protein
MGSKINAFLSNSLDGIVDQTVQETEPAVPLPRQMELRVALRKGSEVVLSEIPKGARIELTIEARDRISLIVEQDVTASTGEVIGELTAIKQLESKLAANIVSNGVPAIPILSAMDETEKTEPDSSG